MSQQVTMGQALASIKEMFPSYEEEVIQTVLTANHNNLETTVQCLLQMEGQMDAADVIPQSSASPNIFSESDPMGNNNAGIQPTVFQSQEPNRAAGGGGGAAGGGAAGGGVAAGGGRPNRDIPTEEGPARRGQRVTLPHNFLRPPNWRENEVTLGDEQLAMMLQNEMFRKEVAANGMHIGNGGGGGLQAPPDMGILKTLNSMGSSAREQLNKLASRFNSNSNNSNSSAASYGEPCSNTSTSSAESASLLHTGDSSSPRFNPLLGQRSGAGIGDDDEEVEIAFGSNNSNINNKNNNNKNKYE
jgi:hypothetical protein